MTKIETNLGTVMIVHSGAHDSTLAYSRLRVVEYNGSSYISIQDVPENILISDTNYWRVICKGALQTWIEQGHEGTYADFIAWLQEPANSAAEMALDTIENLVLAITEAETNRSTAEQTRQTNETARVAAETARNIASNVYNVTLSVPLAAGQYYTSTTARAAVPAGVRKKGLILNYETSGGIWYSERFIGSDIANWTNAESWERLPMLDDLKRGLPSIPFSNRVLEDGGSIRDRVLLKSMYDDALNLLPNTDLWYNFECGIKTRVSGLNTYVTKVYDLSVNNRDAAMGLEAFQPYLVGNINPANRYAIWGRERSFEFSQPIIKSGSDWSLSIIANNLSTNSPFIYPTTGGAIYFYPTYIYFVNKVGESATLSHLNQNAISRYYLVAKNGMLQFYLNGKLLGSSEVNTAIDITNLYSRDAVIYDFRIFNKALNKSEIEFLDAKMSAFYPQIEGVEIGNQYWEASNAMDTIAPDGTLIPEVQPNYTINTTELITNAADREFTSDTGFWERSAGVEIIDGVCRYTNASPYTVVYRTHLLTVGKCYKITYTIKNYTSGLLRVHIGTDGVIRNSNGTYTEYLVANLDTIYFSTIHSTATYDLDDVSVKEAAWSEITTPAWCYFDNNEANGAIYGRIYNGYAIKKLTGSPIWRAPMSADFSQLSAFLGGNAVAGGKMKAEGLTYWSAPNTGATNESGFTAVAGGERLSNGDFRFLSATANFISLSNGVVDSKAISYSYPNLFTDRYDYKYGASLRRIRRVPPGDLVREISSGTFKDNITSGTFKDIPIPNAYRVTALKVTSSTNLTNFTAEVRTSAGVLVQSILSNETINAGDTPVIINISARQKLQLQDYVVRITAVGNGGDGMEVITIIEKAII